MRYAAVAQLDRVTGYEPVGRGFESLQPYHIVADVYRSRRFFIKTAVLGLPWEQSCGLQGGFACFHSIFKKSSVRPEDIFRRYCGEPS